MSSTLRRLPWTCPRRRPLRGPPTTRALSVAAGRIDDISGREDHPAPLLSHAAPEASHDDRILRQIFDAPRFWRDFSHRSRADEHARPKGLFQNRYLTSPDGFHTFAADAIGKIRTIVDKVLRASTVEEYRPIVRDMDRLSDVLCHVIDLADFVRVTHPDRRWQEAATESHARMYEYMNVLNTTTGLNDQLKKAMSDLEVTGSWTEEERVVGDILRKDFAKSAIDLPAREKKRFVDLSNEISQLGSDFVNEMAPAKPYVVLDSGRWKGLDPVMARQLTRWGRVWMPTTGTETTMALRHVQDESVRKELYLASRTAAKRQIDILEELLRGRAELARLAGYESHGHKELETKMAKSPESVESFLQALMGDNKPRVQDELAKLLQLKRASSSTTTSILNPWDRDYYTARQLDRVRSRSRQPDFLPAYFSLGTVMQGLSRLFQRLYGIRFVPRPSTPGETWNADVRRLDVVSDTDGHIAVMYCDLFERAGKSPNPAHFTLRCSRRISADELSTPPSSPHLFSYPAEAATDGMASSSTGPSGDLYQLPTIALICDFPVPTRPLSTLAPPALLTFRELQTLFHEMGHAVHSMLGRTSLHNVSGTRCATDFAELPSNLMERFAADPDVLALFARHWQTDAPLPYAMISDHLAIDRQKDGVDTESQLLLALLDQRYHSALPLAKDFDSTAIFHDVCRQYASFPEPKGTSWQGFFGHLFGYGATYYSYLFDRAIAGRIWQEVFRGGRSGGGVSRERGERLKHEVLRWGGSRDGWECVAGVLGDARLAKGDRSGMAEVGRWGVRD